jgi:hypothetical protein
MAGQSNLVWAVCQAQPRRRGNIEADVRERIQETSLHRVTVCDQPA